MMSSVDTTGMKREVAYIRPIEERDNSKARSIVQETLAHYGYTGPGFAYCDPELQDLTKEYSGNNSRFFVVSRGGEIVGCAGIAQLAGGPDYTCELRKMYILADHRGYGLGRALLQRCLQEARGFGYRKCYLETIAALKTAVNLYRNEGFIRLTAPLGNTGHGSCTLWMSMEL